MSSVTVVGFAVTVIALVAFLAVTFFQLSRVRGIERSPDSDHQP